MIYRLPAPNDPLDQGDILDACPILELTDYDLQERKPLATNYSLQRILVLTQTCDFANAKTRLVVVAVVLNAQLLIDRQLLKPRKFAVTSDPAVYMDGTSCRNTPS